MKEIGGKKTDELFFYAVALADLKRVIARAGGKARIADRVPVEKPASLLNFAESRSTP
ncbi:MAG: hypothetical protein OXG53_09610 [Chloroflexi bacterium]|nr:hypothetical protein [Chloroflexota bacterium]